MDGRQQRGLMIANSSRIKKSSKGWLVPSQSGHGTYVVTMGHEPNCTCPDCQGRHVKCKHIWAVEFTIKKIIDQYGNETIEKEVKVSYTQDWSAYNKAQCNEQNEFVEMLYDLCNNVHNQEYSFGRPTMPMSDMIYSSVMKVYSGFALRRFVSMMSNAKDKGHIDKVCSYSTVSNYMRKDDMTSQLIELIRLSSLPLKSVESDFAIDSSGFSTSEFKRWYDFKYGRDTNERIWLKAHIVVGTKTNVVTSVKITDSNVNDITQFKELFSDTAENFDIKEFSGDKAYLSRDNLELVKSNGSMPYIPFKKNNTGNARGSMFWKKMYHYFQYNRDDFLMHYHKRSNVETAFMMIKTKFGKELKGKTRTAQVNELLCKILCHNIVVLIHEMYELGINPCLKSPACV